MSLAQPTLAWVPALLVLTVLGSEVRRRSRVSRLRRALGRPAPRRFGVGSAALAVAALGLGLAVCGPTAGWRLEPVPRAEVRVVLLMDVSESMNVSDVGARRMTRARLEAHRLSTEVEGARVGVAAFAAEAYTLLPPTGDGSLVGLYLDALDPAAVTSRGSRLGHAVRRVVATFGPPRGTTPGRRAVVVFSDGEDFESGGELQEAAEAARDADVVVYGVLVGSAEGGTVPGRGGVVSRANEEGLMLLASRTGGRVLRPGDPRGFRELVRALSAPAAQEGGAFRRVPVDRTVWLVALSLAALCLEAVGGTLTRRFA